MNFRTNLTEVYKAKSGYRANIPTKYYESNRALFVSVIAEQSDRQTNRFNRLTDKQKSKTFQVTTANLNHVSTINPYAHTLVHF